MEARWRAALMSQPVRLHGERVTVDAGTGEALDIYRTADESTGFLLTACGNRRASRCPACSATYRDDMYHLTISGLRATNAMTPTSANRCARTATTTAVLSCGTPTRASCGGASPRRYPQRWPGSSACAGLLCGVCCASPTRRSPSISRGAWSTSTL
ncbi:replication initiator [Nonomuraea bangladeshensis]|uniref:replication initiator n=1 Tax=Nonomuraea bangladeshensis TaxID=404385 RepID=UPI00338AF9A9